MSTMPSGAPFHILMLPQSQKSEVRGDGDGGGSLSTPSSTLNSATREANDDYISQRMKYRQKRKKLTKAVPGELRNGAAEGKIVSTSSHCGTENDENDGCREGLWFGASPLEMAIADCCDVEGLHDTDVATSYQGGAIRRGKEGKFAALIASRCHTGPDRALALAVLQRTILRDEAVVHCGKQNRKRKRDDSSKDKDDELKADLPENSQNAGDDDKCIPASDKQGSLDLQRNGEGANSYAARELTLDDGDRDLSRMSNFLFLGGLRILNQWLADASTPVADSSQEHKTHNRETGRSSPSAIQGSETGPMIASPTGPILLSLLSVLQSMPFNMELITETKVNKQIRNLKRKLDKAVVSFRENSESSSNSANSTSSDSEEEVVDEVDCERQGKKRLSRHKDPAAGGMCIVRVQAAVESLMSSWKTHASQQSKRSKAVSGKNALNDSFAELHAMMKGRYELLSRYECGECSKPAWLEKMDPSDRPKKGSSITASLVATKKCDPTYLRLVGQEMRSTVEASQSKQQGETAREANLLRKLREKEEELDTIKKKRAEVKEKMELYRRRMKEKNLKMHTKSAAVLDVERKKKMRSKKVSWRDELLVSRNKVPGKSRVSRRMPLADIREFEKDPGEQMDDQEKNEQGCHQESDGTSELNGETDDHHFDKGAIDKSSGIPSLASGTSDKKYSTTKEELEKKGNSSERRKEKVSTDVQDTKDFDIDGDDGWVVRYVC